MLSRFLIFTFICCANVLFAQPYKPLLDDFNEWQFTTCYFGCLTDVYYTDGDTIVEGKSYKILDGYHYISRTFLLRETVAEKKVHLALLSPGQVDEYLLYDFSKEVGDSVQMLNPVTPFPNNGGYFLLDSIVPRQLVDGDSYRHFYFSPTPSNPFSTEPAIWVEGVGSLSMINAPGGHPDINGVGHLSCFFKNGEIFYSNLDSIESCDPVLLGLPIRNTLGRTVVCTPRNSELCILTNTAAVSEIIVFDINGKKTKQFYNPKGDSTLSFDISGFKKGLYFLQIRQGRSYSRSFKLLL